MFSQNIVILLLVASGGGRRSLFTMEVSALEDNSLVEVDDHDLIDNFLHNLKQTQVSIKQIVNYFLFELLYKFYLFLFQIKPIIFNLNTIKWT